MPRSDVWLRGDIEAIAEALISQPRLHPEFISGVVALAHALHCNPLWVPRPIIDASYRFAEGDALRTNEVPTNERSGFKVGDGP